jgi:hypothetical protein
MWKPAKRIGAHGSVRRDLVDIRVVVDVRQIEKDVDLGGLQAQSLSGYPDLAMVDGRTVGREAEIPDGFALLRGIARHQSGEALLVTRPDGLGERIADDEDGRPVLFGFAGCAITDPESVAVGLPGIDDVAPGPLRLGVRCQIVIVVRQYVRFGIGGGRVCPAPLHARKHRGQQNEIHHQCHQDDDKCLAQHPQYFFHLKACLRCHFAKHADLARSGTC